MRSGGVRVLRREWDALAARFPERADDLPRSLVRRANAILVEDAEAGARPEDRPGLAELRRDLVRSAAAVAVLRFELVAERGRHRAARERERATFERQLELERDVVPPLKLEAKRLRAEIRRLQRRAADLGLDVEVPGQPIDWEHTIWVDAFEAPKYQTIQERREATTALFRRLGRR